VLEILCLGFVDAVAWLSPRNRSPDGSLRDIAARHPRSTVRAARMLSWPLDDAVGMERVRFVVADRRGLSFRDAYGYEELRVPFAEIVGLEVVSSDEAQDHLRVRRDRDDVDFWSAETGEGESEVLDALHAAIAPP
jgi:hypothetical protein